MDRVIELAERTEIAPAKTLAIKFTGGNRCSEVVEIAPGTTSGEVLSKIGLQRGYVLSDASGQNVFNADDNIYQHLQDGDGLFVTSIVDAGGN